MKNLHKKIGAIVLAGMVVFGGFAASGAQSFAAEESAKVKLESIISKHLHLRPQGFEIKAEYSSSSSAKNALGVYNVGEYSGKYRVLPSVRKLVGSAQRMDLMLQRLSIYDVFAVEFEGKSFVIVKGDIE